MTRLTYTGPTYDEANCVPLPEGWAAADHDEPDKDVVKEKLESGMYKREKRKKAAKPKAPREKPAPEAEAPTEAPDAAESPGGEE